MDIIQGIDMQILTFIQQNMRWPILDKIMPVITSLGDLGILWILVVVLFLTNKKYKLDGVKLLVALITCAILGSVILKPLIARPRPFSVNTDITVLIPLPHDFSFPSGHSMASFAAATVIFYANKRFGIFAFILAALISFSRLYLYVHYPSDVLAGILIGVLIAFASMYIVNKSFNKTNRRTRSLK